MPPTRRVTGLPLKFAPGGITTLVGPPDAELAALTAAVAVSYKTGVPLIPGFTPEGPSEVSVYPYRGTWIDWRVLANDIGAANDLVPPLLYVRCHRDPLLVAMAARRDPEASTFWQPLLMADVNADAAAATAAGRELPPILTVIFSVESAAGTGDGAVRQLYESLTGKTVLMAGTETDMSWASEYGPVITLPRLHGSVAWRDLLARVTGGDRPEVDKAVERGTTTGDETVAAEISWNAAKRRGRDVAPAHTGPGTLYGYSAVFNQWKEVNNRLDGHFLERIAPGAFASTIAAQPRMKVCFRHGLDPEIGYKSLGTLSVLEEDNVGVWYEVPLVDADHTRALVTGLIAGDYRSSFTYHVLEDDLVKNPERSEHNPLGVPELTVRKVRCSELGPCEHPAFAGTSAGIRLTD